MASAASDVAAAAAAASEASSGSKGLAANTEVEQKDVESVGKDKSDKHIFKRKAEKDSASHRSTSMRRSQPRRPQ